MSDKKAGRKPGVPVKRRGQQMGDERSPLSKMDEAKKNTPALRGRRKKANKMFADESSQHIGADAATPLRTRFSSGGSLDDEPPVNRGARKFSNSGRRRAARRSVECSNRSRCVGVFDLRRALRRERSGLNVCEPG